MAELPDVSRRALLVGAVATAAVAACEGGHPSTRVGHPSTRVGQPSTTRLALPVRGPTSADWQALQASIDGDVVQRGEADFSDAKRLFNPRFDVVRPLAVVEVESSADVAEALGFARRFGLAVRSRAGGHSYVGDSTTSGGIVIDIRRLSFVRYASATRIARVGAGAGLYLVHRRLADHGRSIPAGTCPTVGAAGLTLGGGLGVDSRAQGLTADALIGLTMVTADGQIRQVDAHHEPGLLWAARGGGGGNFGVVTALKYRTFPTRRMGFFLLSFPPSSGPMVIRGWSLRVGVMPRSVWANLRLEASSTGSVRVRIVGVCEAGDETRQAQAMTAAVRVEPITTSVFQKDFLDAVSFLGGGTTSAREAFAAGSDVLPAMTAATSHALMEVINGRAATGRSGVAILDPLTGAVRDVAANATAFPWRRHLAVAQWYVGLPTGATVSQVDAAYRWIRVGHSALADVSSGAYVNYLEPGRRVGAYYGANLARLRRTKQRVDPDRLFRSAYSL